MKPVVAHHGFLHFFTHHRVAANLLMAIMVLSGIWGLSKLNTQFFPNFALDFAMVRVVWSGASAEDVESSITKPIEQELRTVAGLKEITSTSATGISSLTLELEEGTDMGNAMDDINERVARIRNLPSTAEDPEITRAIRYERIARLLITGSEQLDELRFLAYRMKDDLLDRGIAKIDITGLPEEEVAIEISNLQLQELGMSVQQVAERIRVQSQDLPAGFVGKGDVARQLRSLDQQRDATGFAQLPLLTDDQGRLLRVGDVARVERRARDGQVHLFVDGKPAVELLLQRAETSDSLKSARIFASWKEEVEPTLPPHVELRVYDEHWHLIKERITLLLKNGLGGLLLVTAILYLFLNGRVAFWVTVGIPVSFMATLGILYVVGSSINMISLFGLIMALGVIVDDAIVVAENAQNNFENGEDPETAAENGAKHMFAPVASSSLTTIAAFLPLALVGGIIGNIMFQIPLVVICVVIASFIECMMVLPAHMRFSLTSIGKRPPTRLRQRLDKGFDYFRDHIFGPLIDRAIRFRWTTFATAVALFVVAIGLIAGGRIGFTFFPGVDGTILHANASFTAGTPPARVEQFLTHVQQTLRDTEQAFGGGIVRTAVARQGVSSSADQSGQREGEQYGSITVELVSPDKRSVANADFMATWRERVTMPPGIELFNIAQQIGGPPGQDIDIRLIGDDPFVIKSAAAELMDKLREYPGVSAIEDDLPWGQEQLIYHLTPTGRGVGLSVDEVGNQLRAAFDGALVQIFQDRDDEVEVRVRLPLQERESLTALDTFNIVLPDGNTVPLSTVVSLSSKKGFEALRHADAKLSVRVSADVDRAVNNANRILGELETGMLEELVKRYRITYSYEGRAADQAETMADMRRGVLFALLFIYIILAWVFASYSKPLVIMLAIPFGFIGAVVGHLIMGIELTILSLFGIVGLSGIVVNDSIILIAYYQQLRAEGVSVAEAIPLAARARLRAVILTSLTTIGGLTPLLFETSVQAQFLIPMAVSITFGLAFATLLILLVIPSILSIVESVVTRLKPAGRPLPIQTRDPVVAPTATK